MSGPQLTEKQGISVPKPRPDIYTVLLGLSLVAMLVAILCLVLELGRYKWDYKATSVQLRAAVERPTSGEPVAPRFTEQYI